MNNKKVLVIEDDRILQKAIQVALSDGGFEVISASDGEDGLRKAQQEKPGFIVLDIILPKKDGYDVLKELKEDGETKDIPVLMLTVIASKESIDDCQKLGIVDYLIKSEYSLEDIVEKVQENLK